jgi:hypothetical protein
MACLRSTSLTPIVLDAPPTELALAVTLPLPPVAVPDGLGIAPPASLGARICD